MRRRLSAVGEPTCVTHREGELCTVGEPTCTTQEEGELSTVGEPTCTTQGGEGPTVGEPACVAKGGERKFPALGEPKCREGRRCWQGRSPPPSA